MVKRAVYSLSAVSLLGVAQLELVFSIQLSELGIRVDSTNHIRSIVPGSVAAEEETIAVGDKIITVRKDMFNCNRHICSLNSDFAKK